MKASFQTILVGIFIGFFIFAVLIFSGILPIGKSKSESSKPQGKIVVWGTFKSADILPVFDKLNSANKDLVVSYVSKSPDTYEDELIKSFANGKGPDIFLITEDMIIKNKDFIYELPYQSYPEKVFRDSFIDGADVFLDKEGVVGLPLVVDPMVLYYNKDILSNEGIAKTPEYWDELFDLNDKLTKKKTDGTILTSMIALGGYDNIDNAKDILSLLFLQGGNPVVVRDGEKFVSALNSSFKLPKAPAESVLEFYSEFSNQKDQGYSWNRGLLDSKDMFTGGKLAFYIGKASELFNIESVNPNLSFDVVNVLQTKGTNIKRTYAHMYALAINKKSPNAGSAFGVAGLMTTPENIKNFSTAVSLPPASRALLAEKPTDPYLYTFFTSAIVSRTWVDPDSSGTNDIFREMVENVLSSKLSVEEAVAKAQGRLSGLLK